MECDMDRQWLGTAGKHVIDKESHTIVLRQKLGDLAAKYGCKS